MTQQTNGTLGLNIKGQGQSADNIVAYQIRLQAHTNLVMDEPKLAEMLLSPDPRDPRRRITNRVIYRRSGDDHAHTKWAAVDFVGQIHDQAPPGCLLYLGNEPGRGSLELLANWTISGMNAAYRLGRRAVILNFELLAPHRSDWETVLARVVLQAKDQGHLLGLHAYFDRRVADTYRAVQHTLLPQEIFGANCPEITITELGAAIGMHPENGYQGDISSQAYGDELTECARIYAERGITAQVYMYGPWFDFGIQDDETVKDALVAANQRYPVREVVVIADYKIGTVTATTDPNGANVREAATTASAIKGTLKQDTIVSYRPTGISANGYTWLQLAQPIAGFVAASVVTIKDGVQVPFKAGTVTATTDPTGANVRALPTTAAAIKSKLTTGTAVSYRPSGVKANGYTWLELEQPMQGFVASEVVTIAGTALPPKVLLPVPYFSQLSPDANAIDNDCPDAAGASLAHHVRLQTRTTLERLATSDLPQETRGLLATLAARMLPMPRLTVNVLVGKRADETRLPTYIVDLLSGWGVAARITLGLTPDFIRRELDAERPVIGLVAYKHIYPDVFTGGHYVVFVGYNDDGFFIHDPYKAGKNYFLSNTKVDLALSDTQPFASLPYQGVTLV